MKKNINMNKTSKRNTMWLIILITVLIMGTAVIGILKIKNYNGNSKEEFIDKKPSNREFVQEMENGLKLNVSPQIAKTKKLDGLTIENTQLTSQDSQTQILADVKNTTRTTVDNTPIYVILYDKDNNEIVRLEGIINKMEPGETTQLNISSSLDYANAYDFDIVKK